MTRIGSLFSGYGGLDMAVQSVYGGTLAWYSEIEPAACRVLAAHHPNVPNLGDITAVDWAEVEPVDILTGGYPCQPFSHAGKRKGTDDERHLWPYVRDAIRVLRPRVTVLENVKGHLTLGFDTVLADLAELGMSARWGVVRAADAGAPHGRARVFIVAAPDSDQPRPQGAVAGLDVAEGWSDTGGHAPPCTDRAAADADGAGVEGDRRGGARGRGVTGAHGDDVAPPHSDRDGHGRELHAGGMGSLEGEAAGGAPERQRARGESDTGGDEPAADAAGGRLQGSDEPFRNDGPADSGRDGEPAGVRDDDVDWGRYAPAIARWEHVLRRGAPAPTVPGCNGRPRLNPQFVEWMMGLPAGHVTGHGLSAAQELKMLGNGVCPQQAALALRLLAVADA